MAIATKTPKAYDEHGKEITMSQETIEIVRRGKQIILPQGMEFPEAIEWMKRKQKEDETYVKIYHDLEAFPLDGAYAFSRAIEKIYGWSSSKATMITMSISYDKTVQVPWGKVEIPGIEGTLQTGLNADTVPPKFVIQGEVKAKHRAEILKLYEETKRIVSEESVYRGKAIRVDFEYEREDRGFAPLDDEPKFMDISKVNPDDLIFEAQTKRIIRTSLFALIEKAPLMRQHGVPLKRGVLLAGKYGTGKTMTANVTAKLAVDSGFTFIYLKNVVDLAYGLQFAKQYAPAVLFAEDIDRVVHGERTTEMDEILNTLDGVDTKASEIITVLTTNHLEQINPAMLRPGRLDAIVPVNEPDAEAAVQLVKVYGRGLLSVNFDFASVGEALKNNIPAVIRECVERAKAVAIDRVNGDITGKVEAIDILNAVEAMQAQIALIQPKPVDDRHPMTRFGDACGNEIGKAIRDIATTVDGKAINRNGKLEKTAN